VDKEALFNRSLPTAEVEIPGVGTVTVRGMSRMELMLAAKPDDHMEQEALLLHWCMVDPALSKSDAKRWQESSLPDEIAKVTEKIRDLSGIKPGGDREVAKSVEPESGS
jgi:hypothetical protein